MPTDALIAAAKAWVQQDPDPTCRTELEALIGARSSELNERFAGPLVFGTAGLRGIVGAGESRMNRAVVRRTSAGLAKYLLEHHPDASERGVVVGYDGRHLSDVFARDTAAVLCAAGITTHLSSTTCPTPAVAFAVTDLNAVAGVMVTASHNPPQYNGYKVYAANGAQIISPTDRLIAESIAAGRGASDVPVADLDNARERGLLRSFGDDIDRRYLDAIAALTLDDGGDRSLSMVYTPLHGVGHRLLRIAMEAAGFDNLHTVAEQAEPDGNFPTVAFPNPEEDGALDLALALAKEKDAALIIANDPDADRLAAAVRTAPGKYLQLTGNELGTLLGHHLIQRDAGTDKLVIASLVSSPLLGVIARELGVAYAETLTGFKWIANKAMQLERDAGKRFVFGYEEALGYTVGTVVRDKDGISAAVVLASLAAELRTRGETLVDELFRIAQRFGLYASGQRSLGFSGADGPQRMAAMMASIRETPPEVIGDAAVIACTDVANGTRRDRSGDAQPIDLPESDVLVFDLDGGHRVIARPSGTEPKMKIYFDVRETLHEDDSLASAKSRANAHIDRLASDFLDRFAPST